MARQACAALVYWAIEWGYDQLVTVDIRGIMESDKINPANQRPTCDDDESATIATLLEQVQSIVEQSGNPDGFDASSWLDRWLRTPVPGLGSRPPIELLGTPEGVVLVSSTIARMQSGAYM